ncbi:MAG: hypothetical protein ABW217_15870 [Polyangiaceae bacterium]
MSAVGTAAVIAGAMMSDDGCYGDYERGYERGQPCRGGGMSGSEKAGVAIAVAGLATAAVGNALQEDAARLDARRRVYQGPTYTPTTLPPPVYAPAGTFHPFPSSTVVQTTSCTCREPVLEPEPCAATGDERAAPAPENAGSPGGSHNSEATGCTCAPEPALTAPSEAGTPEAAPQGEATPAGEPEQAAPEQAAPEQAAPTQ